MDHMSPDGFGSSFASMIPFSRMFRRYEAQFWIMIAMLAGCGVYGLGKWVMG
jgi:hypothetical protein